MAKALIAGFLKIQSSYLQSTAELVHETGEAGRRPARLGTNCPRTIFVRNSGVGIFGRKHFPHVVCIISDLYRAEAGSCSPVRSQKGQRIYLPITDRNERCHQTRRKSMVEVFESQYVKRPLPQSFSNGGRRRYPVPGKRPRRAAHNPCGLNGFRFQLACFLRHPRKPIKARPVPRSGSAAGSGTTCAFVWKYRVLALVTASPEQPGPQLLTLL